MEPNETMVAEVNEAEAADQLVDSMVDEEPEAEVISLDDVTSDGETAEEHTETEAEPEPTAKEPGYVKRRISEALDKERGKIRAEVRAEMQEEFDRRMAPIMDRLLTDDAKELVRSGEFKSLETAKEYLRLKQGMPASQQETKQDQPRNANGQYAPKQDSGDAATMARIDMLKHQAERIKESRGVDVIAEFNNNPEVNRKVKAGEMDFYDVAEAMATKPKKSRPPAPMRSPNGAATDQQVDAIMNMTTEQFNRLQEKIRGGAQLVQK